MISLTKTIAPEKNHNAYILFGWEAIEARPNLDPYTGNLRMNDETLQVYTSDVHIKHHVRRGIKHFAQQGELESLAKYKQIGNEGVIFYEKSDDYGISRSFEEKLKLFREAHGVDITDKGAINPKDALNLSLDIPLFGYVHAVAEESYNVTNAANTLFRPATFHACSILPLGRNNAFVQPGKASAGSAPIDSLEYGFFLALWEINLNMLKINAGDHKVVTWDEKTGYKAWLEILINGMWNAYTSARFPSFTQRSQFAQFLLCWQPEEITSYRSPKSLIEELDDKEIKDHTQAVENLNNILKGFLQGWGRDETTSFVDNISHQCDLKL